MRFFEHRDPEEYRFVQRRAWAKKKEWVWVREKELDVIAGVIGSECRDQRSERFGLCHGCRTGLECQELERRLGFPVFGTDIGDPDYPDCRPNWDFHDREPEWIGKCAFVYSNALDHSNRPVIALATWAEQLAPGGVLILHWEPGHNNAASASDCFGATKKEYEWLIRGCGLNPSSFVTDAKSRRLIVGTKSGS